MWNFVHEWTPEDYIWTCETFSHSLTTVRVTFVFHVEISYQLLDWLSWNLHQIAPARFHLLREISLHLQYWMDWFRTFFCTDIHDYRSMNPTNSGEALKCSFMHILLFLSLKLKVVAHKVTSKLQVKSLFYNHLIKCRLMTAACFVLSFKMSDKSHLEGRTPCRTIWKYRWLPNTNELKLDQF